jgi:hypothetical protein
MEFHFKPSLVVHTWVVLNQSLVVHISVLLLGDSYGRVIYT